MFAILLLCYLAVCTGLEHNAICAQLAERLQAFEEKVANQEDRITHQQRELQRLQLENDRLKGHVTASKRQADYEGPVGFSAGVKPVFVDHMHNNDGVIYDSVLSNYGNGYNSNTGEFVAPASGIYLFSASVFDEVNSTVHGGVKIHAEIVHNGVTQARVFAHAESTQYQDQGAQTIIVEISKGDKMWVRIVDNNNLGLGGNLYTTFSGYLLWQMYN